MAVDLERLVVQLSADVRQYNNAMNKAIGVTNRQAKGVENRFAKMNKNVSTSFLSLGKTMVGVFAGGAFVASAIKFSEAATRIDNALKVAGLSGDELERVLGRLHASATKNAAPIEALVELYGRAALVQKELGITGEELLGFTDKIAVALRVSGKSAAESSGALLQLSQALGSGVVRAEEFNSILEGALPIAQAAAAGLKEAGGSVAKLRQLVVEGAVSSEAFFRAFEAGAPMLEEKVAGATFTVAQATGNLSNALIKVAGEFNKSTGAGEKFAGAINTVAQSVSDFDVSGFISKIQQAHGVLDEFMDTLGNAEVFDSWNRLFGLMDSDGNVINLDAKEANAEVTALEREVQMLQERIALNTELGFDTSDAIARLNDVSARLTQVRASAASLDTLADLPGFQQPGQGGSTRGGHRSNTVLNTVSLGDFAPPSSKKTGGGRKGGGSKDKKDEWQREVEQIKERTAAIQAETAAMATLNPLVEDYGFTLEKARSTHELLTAAQKAGIAITPELRAKIDELATGYANASVEAEKLAEAQDKAREAVEDMRDLGKDVMGGFISDLIEGKSAADALAGALGKIGDKLLDMAMNDLFGKSGSSGLGILGSLFGGGGGGFSAASYAGIGRGLFSSGGYTGPGGVNDPAGIVHKGEVVWSQDDIRKAGGVAAVEAMRAGGGVRAPVMPRLVTSGGGGAVSAPVSVTIDARGADREGLARVEQQVAKLKGELPARIVQGVRQAQKSNVKLG